MPQKKESFQTRGIHLTPRMIDFAPRPGVSSTIRDQHERSLRASRWSLAVDLPNTTGLTNAFEVEQIPTIRDDKMITDWRGVATTLRMDAPKSSDAVDRERVMQLSKIADACEKLEKNLVSYVRGNHNKLPVLQNAALVNYLGKRDSQDVVNDTYFTHGARCASYVYDMGVTDPYAFAVAGLHDLAELLNYDAQRGLGIGKTSVRNVVINELKTAFSGIDIDVDRLEGEITRFAKAAEERHRTAEKAFANLPERFLVGREFTLQQFVDFEAYIAAKVTNTPSESGVFGQMDYGPSIVQEDQISPSRKFPNVVQVLAESNSSMTPSTAKRKGKKLPPSPALHIAELAAALDHSYFPKKPIEGETPEDRVKREQIYATGLMTTLFPIYQAYGDPARRLALEVIYRAFMPDSMSNLYTAVEQMAQENGGRYVDAYDEMYSQEVKSLVENYLRINPTASLVSDSEMEARKLEHSLGLRRDRKVLEANEINVTGLDYDEDGNLRMVMNRKSAGSIVYKFLGLLADEDKRKKLDPKILEIEFGSVEFWRYVLPRFHDFLRAQFTLGQAQRDVFIGYLMGNFSDQSSNVAESLYAFADNDAKLKDMIEHKEGSLNIIYAHDLPNAVANNISNRLNCELHAIGVDEDVKREEEPTSTHRVPYKLRRMVKDQLLPKGADNKMIAKMREDLAREAIRARKNYLNMVYGAEDNAPALISGNLYASSDGGVVRPKRRKQRKI